VNGPYYALLNSQAASLIDIIACHPYDWQLFRTPEVWHDQFLQGLKQIIASSPTANKNMAIMYTEVGAPVSGTDAPGDRAQSPAENAQYLVKIHVMAYNGGVERVYWYQGQDTCSDQTNAECNFGLITNGGVPRPAYQAYRTMTSCMNGKNLPPVYTNLVSGVRYYDFAGSNGHCIIAWTYLSGVTQQTAPSTPTVSMNLSSITTKQILSVKNTVGANMPTNGNINLSPAPIFIETSP